MVIKCTCEHRYQDWVHGASKRVANPLKKTVNQQEMCRCTVCLKVHPVPPSSVS